MTCMTITTLIISLLAYIIGYLLSFLMLLTEVKSESETVTIGDRALMISLSLLSWFMVLYCLITAWISKINSKGYWDKPLKGEIKEEIK